MTIWDGATVLITGGTGSFGHAFTRLLLGEQVRAIRIYSRDEFKQSRMRQRFTDQRLRFLLGDVRDRERLMRACDGVDIVVHAAALKQIAAAEYNPTEAIKTNVLGAMNVIEAALERKVARVMALSTDKAAAPLNLYGATKLCAEKLFVDANAYGGLSTRFGVVRYGNVVGSRGSIIPVLRDQSRHGWVNLTDPRMTRFWITLEQATAFIKARIEGMRLAEVFIPKIPSVRIVDVVAAVAPGVDVHVTGIRPGEKLHETLVTLDESRNSLDLGDHYVLRVPNPQADDGTGSDDFDPEFVYESGTNSQWLSIDEIRAALETLGPAEEAA